jgi:hypothetical protein
MCQRNGLPPSLLRSLLTVVEAAVRAKLAAAKPAERDSMVNQSIKLDKAK